MRAIRAVLMVTGVGVAAYGGWRLSSYSLADLFGVALFLAGGLIAHDALLAPTTVAVGLTGSVLPRWLRAPAAVGLIVLGTVTVLAVPVLGRFGARPDNPTLLDRHYWLGWFALAAVIIVAVGVAGWRRRAAMPLRSMTDTPGRVVM